MRCGVVAVSPIKVSREPRHHAVREIVYQQNDGGFAIELLNLARSDRASKQRASGTIEEQFAAPDVMHE